MMFICLKNALMPSENQQVLRLRLAYLMDSFLFLLLIIFLVISFTSGSLGDGAYFAATFGVIIGLLVLLLNNFSFGVAIPLFAVIGIAVSLLLPSLLNRNK